MSTFFLEIFEITLGMSVLILAMLLILRFLGKKFTAKCRYVLWGLVLLRLAIPLGLGVLPAMIEVPIVPAIVESGELNGELTEIVTPGDSVTGNVIDSTDMPSVTNPTEPTTPTNPINPTNPTIPVSPSTPADPSTPTIPETPPTPTDPVITPISPNGDNTTDPMKEQITTPDPVTETPRESVSAGTILEIISTVYIMGAAVFFTWNMISYVIYTRRILAAARPVDSRTAAVFKSICAKENLKHTPTLLVSPEINSPAAFGIFSRKVVLPDIDFTDNALAGTLFHEVVHCKRGDLYVKFIGLLARSLHWFNPLVYIAAMRCEMEMEMSCDERVLAGVSDEARVAYGSVMLDIIRRCRRNKGALTTHFNPKKSSVKTRFLNIINGSGKRNGKVLIAICLVLCIIAGTIIACTTDPVDTPEETDSESESESELESETETTDPEDETEPAEDEVPTIDVAQYVNVLENKVGLEFSSIVIPKNDFISCCYFDEERVLVSTYDVERGENNEIECYSDFTLYLINTMRGTLEDFVVLGDMSYRPISKNYTENGLILSDWHLDDDGNMVFLGAILVSQQGGKLSVVPDNTEIYPRHDSILKSPDGRYTVFDTTDDGTGHGAIDVVYPDGTTKRILTNVMEGDPGVKSLGDVTGYSPIQFIDNERLLYHIGGWEWTQGYGIYNLATGEKTEFREGYAAMGYSDGYIYLSKSSGYEIVSYHKATLDGEILDTVEPDDNSIELGSGVAYAMFIREGQRKIYSVDSLLGTLNRTHSDVVYYVYDGNGDKWAELAKVHYDTREAEIYAISHDNRETTLIFVDGAPMPEKTAGDAPIVNVLENNAGLDINTVFLPVYKDGGYMDAIKFDEQHMLYITYEVAKNEETGKYYKTKPQFYLIDILNGEIIDDYPYYALSDSEDLSLFEVDYTDDGIIFMEMGNLGDRLGVMKAYRLTYDGALKFTPVVRIELYPYNSSKIVSPTGEYVVYYRDEGGYGDGGIDVVYAGGAKYRFLNNVTLDNAGGSLGAVTYYTPVGFADDSHLVYSIGGYEHIKGFGIYDLATGENKMFEDGKYQLSIVGDGVISFEEVRRNDEGLPEQYRTWTMTLDGKMKLTASVDEADGVPTMPRNISNRLRSEPIYSFTSRSFKVVPDYFYKTVSYVVESIYSPDMKEKLAVIEYPSDSNQRAVRNIHFADNSVTIVLPVDPAALSTGSEDTPLVNVISNPGGLDVQTVYIPTYINGRSAYANIFEFDERYVICVTYDDSYNNATLYVIDTSLGQIIHEEALTEYGTGGSVSYIDSSVVLLNYYVQIEGVSCRRSTEIRIENGAVQVIEGLVDYVGYPRCEGQVKSPDGRYTAYNVLDDEAYHGGVDLLCPDGTIKRIKENYVIHMGEGTESDVYVCRSRYSPLGFIDDKHLVIIRGAYESPSGYEIYNVETGELTQGLQSERVDDYYIQYSPAAIIDGYLYLNVWKNGPISYDEEIIGVGKIDLDGNFTMLAHRDETDGVFTLPEDEYFKIRNEVWHMYDSRFNAWSMKLEEFFKSTGYRVTKKFYSADFELLLELEYPYFTLKALNDVYVYGDTCTVITFVDNSNVISASAFETAYRNAENVYSWFTGYGGFEALMEWTTVDGQSYQRCDMLEFDTLAELESITARYFSKDLTDKLMNTTAGMFGTPLYVEENGKLYKVSGYFSQFGYDAVYDYKFERLGYSDGEYSVKVTASFCPYGKEFTASAECKYVIMDDGSIVFTEFPLMIEELMSFWISLSQIEDSGTTVSREDLSSIYKDVEFTTYTYDESDFYGYTVTIDIPSYCYRYNGVYLEPNTLTNSDKSIYRALLTKYEHSYAEFEAGVDLYRDANIMSIKNRTSVFKDISSENINGFFGYIDKDGTPYCVYAFYFPTDRHGEAIVLYLWQRLGADGNLYYSNVILPIVRSVKIEKESTTQEGGTIYFTSSPTSFLPPEASSRVGDLKFGNSHIITYASDKYGLCVYYSYCLDAESFVMLKTEFEPADIQTYHRSEVLEPELNEDGIVIATVRYFHYGSACYTDVTYELDPSLYVSPGEPNEERIYRTPVWKVVDKAFTLHERAVVSLIAGKNGCVEFWHKFMGSDWYLYFITLRDEEHNPTKHFSLYYFDAGNAGDGFDLVNIEIPEDVEYDTIMPINYITGGGSMECRFYLELTKDGEVFYVAFDNFHWETGDDILDFRYQGIVSDDEIAELHANYPDLFKDLAE